MDRKNWGRAGFHPPPPFFSLLPFRLVRIFFFQMGKKGLPRHTFALLTNRVQVSEI